MNVVVGFGGAPRNAAVALSVQGRLLAACERERVIRVRGVGFDSGRLPAETCEEVARIAGCDVQGIDTYAGAEPGISLPPTLPYVQLDHHFAHAATAFLTSAAERAAILICDRHSVPEVSVWRGDQGTIASVDVGWSGRGWASVYSECAQAFGLAGQEHKLEALARLGDTEDGDQGPPAIELTSHGLVTAGPVGALVSERLSRVRAQGLPGLAAVANSVQARLGDLLTGFLREIRRAVDVPDLCLGGGLFYNTGFNTRIAESGVFTRTHVPVNPGNAGLAAGTAVAVGLNGAGTRVVEAAPSFLGPEYDSEAVKAVLDNCKLSYEYLSEPNLIAAVVDALARGCLVGWFQGRMECGHRALGHRSILASPLAPYVLHNLNMFLRKRESHHSFGLSVCDDDCTRYFDGPPAAALMEYDYRVTAEETFRHVLPQGARTLRVHTVGDQPALLRTLLKSVGAATGVPVLVNTSFNGFHEPIVCSPRDAVRVFYGTGLDVLVIGQFLLRK